MIPFLRNCFVHQTEEIFAFDYFGVFLPFVRTKISIENLAQDGKKFNCLFTERFVRGDFCDGFDLLHHDFIMFAMQIFIMSQQIKVARQRADDRQRCTRMVRFLNGEWWKRLRFRWFRRRYCRDAFISFKYRNNGNTKRLKDTKIPPILFPMAISSIVTNQFLDLFPVFLPRNELQIFWFATKDYIKKNMFTFIRGYFAQATILKKNSFPRNQACVWKEVLVPKEQHLPELPLLLVLVFAHIKFRGKEL